MSSIQVTISITSLPGSEPTAIDWQHHDGILSWQRKKINDKKPLVPQGVLLLPT
jgi:hypothetical protein